MRRQPKEPAIKFVRLLITLPEHCKQFLDDLRRLEGTTNSGYLRKELEEDIQSRVDAGWNHITGWDELTDRKYQKRMAAAQKRAEQQHDRISSHLKRKRKNTAGKQSAKKATHK